eukprot:6211777-Pleurochrysis_carterae.AAC.7
MHAVKQGVFSGRLDDLATAAEAELFAIFATLRKVQAQQDLGVYGQAKARETSKWSGIEGYRECEGELGNGDFFWIPSHVGIFPNMMADNIAARESAGPEGSGGQPDLSGGQEKGDKGH